MKGWQGGTRNQRLPGEGVTPVLAGELPGHPLVTLGAGVDPSSANQYWPSAGILTGGGEP